MSSKYTCFSVYVCVCVYVCSVVSNSLQPHGLQSSRLLCPWNFSSKDTGVGCHFLLQGTFPTQGWNPHLLCLLHLQADSLLLAPPGRPPMLLCAVRLFATPKTAARQAPLSMGFSRQEYWSGLPCLLQGIFPTQGSNPGLLHCRWILYQLSSLKVKVAQLFPTLCDFMDYTVQGLLQARILEWIAFPFSRRSSQPRDRTQVSHIAGGWILYQLSH